MLDGDDAQGAGEAGPPARKLGKRQAATIERILEGTVRALHRSGAQKLQISAICTYAGVSRGTLYRHFPTKDDLLGALADHRRAAFKRELHTALAAHADPKLRLHAAMVFLNVYVEDQRLDLSLEIEPQFVLTSLRRNYVHYAAAVEQELQSVFDALEAEAGQPIDRPLCTEFLMRNAYSAALLPGGVAWLKLDKSAEQAWRMFAALRLAGG